MVMIATILLIVNFAFLLFKGSILMPWLWVVLAYPIEIILYFVFGISFLKIMERWFD